MIFVVLAVWLVGTWVTKYSLSEMAVFTPIAILALGAFAGVILLWVKIVRESLRGRDAADRASPASGRPARAGIATVGESAPSDALRTVVSPCATVPGRSSPASTPR